MFKEKYKMEGEKIMNLYERNQKQRNFFNEKIDSKLLCRIKNDNF